MQLVNLGSSSLRMMLGLVLLSGFLAMTPGLFAQKNLVYIDGDITATGQNAVVALVNDGAGNMSPVAGSPFATLGTGVAGTGDPLADAQWNSDGEMAINRNGTLLYAVNGHSNNFSGFNINADGSLTLITGSPFSSGGTQPASIGWRENALGNGISVMVIANKDSDPFQTQTNPNYTTFQVDGTGIPVMNAGSAFALPANSSPSQILMPKSGTAYFFGVLYFGKNVGTYKMNRAGIMTKTSSLRTPGNNVGAVLHPNIRGIYVTNPNVDMMTVLSYDTSFNIANVKSLSDPGKAPCWISTSKAGTRLYTGETLSGSVTVWDITNTKNPAQLQHLVLQGTMPYATHTRLDPTEKFLYVLDRQGVLHVLDVQSDGTVAENHTPFNLGLPTGTVPLGVAVLSK